MFCFVLSFFFLINLVLICSLNINCGNFYSIFRFTQFAGYPKTTELGLLITGNKNDELFSYLAKDAVNVFITGYKTREVKVLHDPIEADSYFLIFLQITASKLGVILTEDQWGLGLKRRLVVQTLGMRVPPSRLEKQHQHMENEMRNESKVPFLDLWDHDELSLSLLFFP